jgi:hypothetical protein
MAVSTLVSMAQVITGLTQVLYLALYRALVSPSCIAEPDIVSALVARTYISSFYYYFLLLVMLATRYLKVMTCPGQRLCRIPPLCIALIL